MKLMSPMSESADYLLSHQAEILDLADDAIISVDEDQRIVLFNRGAERIFGYKSGEIRGLSLDKLLPARLTDVHRRHVRDFAASGVNSRQMGERREILGRRKDGSEFPAEASISKAHVAGRHFFTVILRDVTARHLADAKIRASLQEKEILLKEIHHRVKNNLQVISSLLGLQARTTQDGPTRKMFEESQNRIHSMALLHEALYHSENLSHIDSRKYFEQLCAYLFHCYGVSTSRVELHIDLDDIHMILDTAVPCGLIVNEMVSNALKYAFPKGRRGRIQVELRRMPDSKIILRIGDNGVGLPEGVGLWTSKSLGLRLVRTLADQLGADIELNSGEGTEVRLIFPSWEREATA